MSLRTGTVVSVILAAVMAVAMAAGTFAPGGSPAAAKGNKPARTAVTEKTPKPTKTPKPAKTPRPAQPSIPLAATNTATPSPTETATPTATSTEEPSATPTATPSPTETPLPSPTPTATSTPCIEVLTAYLRPSGGDRNAGPLPLDATRSTTACGSPLLYFWSCASNIHTLQCDEFLSKTLDGTVSQYELWLDVDGEISIGLQICTTDRTLCSEEVFATYWGIPTSV